jgi:hypothetical protein
MHLGQRRSPLLDLRIFAAVVAAVGVTLTLALISAQARPVVRSSARAAPVAHAASSSAFKVKLVNTDFGSVGSKGHFSVKVGRAGHLMAALIAAATGLPFKKIAKGGTYIAKVNSNGKGGIGVVTFADHALGQVCVKFTAHAAPYNPSLGYLVVSGSMTVVGGTRAAAHWKGTAKFKQTGLTGSDTLAFSGSASGSTRKAHGLTSACKSVKKLKGG